jgi:thiol-disulfide isomerase/thioredoxin
MTMDQARFQTGLTYEAYKAAMSRNRERLEENERRVALDPDTVRFFRSLPRPLKVVALAEDWCGDVIANLPVLGRLAAEVGTLDVRVFYRDQNDDLMERWLNQGKFKSIPVFAFFDDGFRELFAAHPEFGSPDAPVDQLPEDVRLRLQAELQKMRDETTAFANTEVQRELRELVAAAPAR